MTSLLSVPVRQPYKLVTNQFDGAPITEIASIFKPDLNSRMNRKDKLHQWAMWRTNVNHSFIRNLPVPSRSEQPVDEATVREKRIDIDRFLLYSDTDELKRLHMKESYGTCSHFTSELGDSTYFLYGLPRILLRTESLDSHSDRSSSVEYHTQERLPRPKPKTHLFVGAGQGVTTLKNQGLNPIDLSHAQRVKYGQAPASVMSESVIEEEEDEEEGPQYEVWKKTYLIQDKEDDYDVHNYAWDTQSVVTDDASLSDQLADHNVFPVFMNGHDRL